MLEYITKGQGFLCLFVFDKYLDQQILQSLLKSAMEYKRNGDSILQATLTTQTGPKDMGM